MRQSTVTFAMRDFDRLKCIQAVIDGQPKPIRAAERLGLTTRQVVGSHAGTQPPGPWD
jgi:hypothetical protein